MYGTHENSSVLFLLITLEKVSLQEILENTIPNRVKIMFIIMLHRQCMHGIIKNKIKYIEEYYVTLGQHRATKRLHSLQETPCKVVLT